MRAGGAGTDAAAAHAVDAAAGAMRAGVFEIGGGELRGGLAAIDAREQQSSGAFQNRERGAAKKIGKTYVDGLVATADGEYQAAVRVELHAKTRGTAVAAQAREDALE